MDLRPQIFPQESQDPLDKLPHQPFAGAAEPAATVIDQLNGSADRNELKPSSSWSAVIKRSQGIGIIAACLLPVILIAAIIFSTRHNRPPISSAGSQSLTQSQLEHLTANGVSFSSPNLELTFHSPVAIEKDLKVAGTTTLDSLTVSGIFSPSSLNVNKDLQVNGAGLLQGNLTTKGQLSVGGNLAVAGTSTFAGNANFNGNGAFNGSISANSLNVRTASIGGLSFGHIITTGATPSAVLDAAAGAGSFQVSGDDTSGSITIHIGSGPHDGDMVTLSFRSAFSSTPHIALTPVGITSAGVAYYVTRSVTEFSVGMKSAAPGTYTFDYVVTQ